MKNLKKNLQSVNKELKALAKKVDKIVVAVGKKPAAKKPAKLTAVDTVLAIIRRSRKGVDTATLKKKTGFIDYKIHNIVYKLKQQGKIKSVGRGVYLKA